MFALTLFRSKAADLSDLLNYTTLVDEGVVLGRDGPLMTGFFFRGDDVTSATTSKRNYLIALVNQYLFRFGTGWSLWTGASRLSSSGYPRLDESFFPEPVTAMIDVEHRAPFVRDHALFEGEYTLILAYLPPTRRDLKLSEMIYDDDGIGDTGLADRLLTDFEKELDDLQDGLGDLPHMRCMGIIEVGEDGGTHQSNELVNYLHYTLTNKSIALRIPDYPMYLDAWLGHPSFWLGDTPKVGDKFVSCMATKGFPGNSHPGIFNMLGTLPMICRWSSRFVFLEQREAVAALNHYRLK